MTGDCVRMAPVIRMKPSANMITTLPSLVAVRLMIRCGPVRAAGDRLSYLYTILSGLRKSQFSQFGLQFC